MNCIELTVEEKALLGRIDFAPTSPERHDPEHWNAVGEAALGLMKSLIARKAIPDVRSRYFTDPDFNVGGRGRSRAQIPFSEILALLPVRAGLAASGDQKVPAEDCGHGACHLFARRVLKTAHQSSRAAQRRSRRRVLQAGSRLRSRTVRGAINP